MALRAFVNPPPAKRISLPLKRAGKAIHNKFLEENRYKSIDPAMMPWPELRKDFKESNIQQAAYARDILLKAGYGVRAVKRKARILVFGEREEDKVELMAEMEHGRWIDERLRAGWTYGPNRDPENKVSPYLVQWGNLSESIKDYDRDVVRNLPRMLAEAGIEVYRPRKKPVAKQ